MRGGALGTVTVPGAMQQPHTVAWFVAVTPDYFRTLGIPLVRGSGLDASAVGEPHAVVIDEAAAREYFPGEDPLGKRITIYGNARGHPAGGPGCPCGSGRHDELAPL